MDGYKKSTKIDSRQTAKMQRFLSTSSKRLGAHHYKGYNEPGGFFLGMKPAPDGYKRKMFWYEPFYVYLMGATWTAFFIGMYYRPDTEMESWARQEALIRMKERGESWDTEGKPY